MSSGYAPAPPPYNPAQESWFSRNGKWFVPLLVLLIVVFVLGIFAFVFGMMKSSEPYKHAVDLALHDPLVTSALGAPVKPGWYVTGSIRFSGSSGTADLAIPLRGQLHKGKVYVLARKFAGEWTYLRIVFQVEDQPSRIDLLHHMVPQRTVN